MQYLNAVIDTQKVMYRSIGNTNAGDDLTLTLKITRDNNVLDFESPTFEFLAKKSDGNRVRQLANIEQDGYKVKITCDKQILTTAGVVTSQLIIKEETRTSSVLFYFTVNQSLDTNIVQSIESVDVLEELDAYVVTAFENLRTYEQRVLELENEMKISNDEFNTNEEQRKTNETNRISKESERNLSENDRKTKENERISAESTRVTNEDERIRNETERVSKENARALAEVSRNEKETERNSDENTRKQNETTRNGNENIRTTNETKRISAENTRNDEEDVRKQNEEDRKTKIANFEKEIENMNLKIKNINDVLDGKTGKKFGVRFYKASSNPAGERLGDSFGLTANAGTGEEIVQNDFDDLYPFGYRRLCNLGADGRVMAYKGDPSFRRDGTNGDVMVETPIFWQKYVETSEYIEYWVADHEAPGFRLSPRFKTKSGLILEKIYTGAYKANLTADNKLASYSGAFPSVEAGRQTFRNWAKAKSPDFGLIDIAYRCDILNYLFYIEFATRNSQAIMQGLTTFQWDYTTTSETTNGNTLTLNSTNIAIGFTLRVGGTDRRVTDVTGSTVTVDGEPFTVSTGTVISSRGWINGSCDNIKATSGSVISNTDGKSCCIYRGEENPWGNIWEWVDGCNIQDRQTYVHYNPEEYTDDKFTAPYIATSYTNASTDGYVVTMGNDESNPYVQLPIGVGGSSSTYFADYYYQSTGNRAPRVGATLHNGSNAGLSYWNCNNAFSNSNRNIGARLYYLQIN